MSSILYAIFSIVQRIIDWNHTPLREMETSTTSLDEIRTVSRPSFQCQSLA